MLSKTLFAIQNVNQPHPKAGFLHSSKMAGVSILLTSGGRQLTSVVFPENLGDCFPETLSTPLLASHWSM